MYQHSRQSLLTFLIFFNKYTENNIDYNRNRLCLQQISFIAYPQRYEGISYIISCGQNNIACKGSLFPTEMLMFKSKHLLKEFQKFVPSTHHWSKNLSTPKICTSSLLLYLAYKMINFSKKVNASITCLYFSRKSYDALKSRMSTTKNGISNVKFSNFKMEVFAVLKSDTNKTILSDKPTYIYLMLGRYQNIRCLMVEIRFRTF